MHGNMEGFVAFIMSFLIVGGVLAVAGFGLMVWLIYRWWTGRNKKTFHTPIKEGAATGFAIRHVDGRWRTMDTLGMPDWTIDPAKALVMRLRAHADAFAADDPEDVRIEKVMW